MEMQRHDLIQVLKLLHLNKDLCLHEKLEKIAQNDAHVFLIEFLNMLSTVDNNLLQVSPIRRGSSID